MEPSNDSISSREFDNTIRALTNTMADGFAGLNQRLDTLNGKTNDNASDIKRLLPVVSEQGAKIRNLDREVFGRRRDDNNDEKPKELDDKPVTRREVNIAIAVATTCLIVIIWLFTVFGPQMINGVKP